MNCLKKLSCLALTVLLVMLTACGADNSAEQPPEKEMFPVSGPNADGEITFGDQTFSVDSERLTLNLQIRSNETLDLSPLAWCTRLEWLSIHLTVVPHIYYDKYGDPYIAEQPPVDLAPLSSLAGLKRLELNVGRIQDLTPLSGLQSLNSLVLWIDGEVDLKPLAFCAGLTELALGGRGTVDLAPVRGFSALTGLRVDVYDDDWNTPDLSALSGTPKLEILNTGASRGLKELTNVPLSRLIDLNDSGDILENLPQLETLTYLEFSDEHLEDIQPLLLHPGITEIVLEVGAQDIASFTVVESADDPLLDRLITSIPLAQLRKFLTVDGARITIVVDQNRTAGAVE